MMIKYMTRMGLLSLCLLTPMLTACGSEEDPNDEIVQNLLDAGFDAKDIEIRDAELLTDGELVEGEFVFVDGDVHVTLEASREFADIDTEGEGFRHWHSPGLVGNASGTICLAKVNSASGQYVDNVLTTKMKTGVERAKTNLKDINGLSLNFKSGGASISAEGILSHSISGCTYSIFIYQVDNDDVGGSAGFPSGGAPYNQVRLNSGLTGNNKNVHEHVATHEIVHAIGLRHSDWRTRSSCGENVDEGQNGAIQINDTPDQTTNSLMAACFSLDTNGEFRGDDKRALKNLY